MTDRGALGVAHASGRHAIFARLSVAGLAMVALVHATLRSADPPIGGRVAQPPSELRLEFSEAVSPRTSRIDLVAPDSERFALQVSGDSAMANVLLADVPTLGLAGRYRVEWRLVGSDGHAVTGNYGFTVDSIPVPIDTAKRLVAEEMPPGEATSDSFGQRVIRFAASLVLATVIGSVGFALFVLPVAVRAGTDSTRNFRSAVDARLRTLCVVGGWSILALGVVRLVSHGATLSGSMAALSFGDLGDLIARSTFGRGWLLQMSAAIALLVALSVKRFTRWRVPAGMAVALAISAALLGHPAAVTDLPVLAVGLDAVHMLGAGGWAGALLAMSIAAVPQVGRIASEDRLVLARNLLRAFTPLALTCAAVLALTGAASAWLQIRDLGLVWGSPYGQALLRKVVVVLMVAALGAYHWRVAQPSLDSEQSMTRLRRSIAFDVALVLLVLVLTAILTGTPPPAPPAR